MPAVIVALLPTVPLKVPALIVPAFAIPPEAVIAPVEVKVPPTVVLPVVAKVPPTETFPVELATVKESVPSFALMLVTRISLAIYQLGLVGHVILSGSD